MSNGDPVGDLDEQMAHLYRAVVVRGLRKTGAVVFTDLLVFIVGIICTLLSPLTDRWYIGVPVLACLTVFMGSFSYRDDARLPAAPAFPHAPHVDEGAGAGLLRVRDHLENRSRPVNKGDLRDHVWWTTTALFAFTVPGVGSYVAHSSGYLTYGVAAAWLYTVAILGLGWLQSRLLVFSLEQVLFVVHPENRDSPE
jgi:hypothetical protein